MKILSIETSCDETAVSIIEAEGDIKKTAPVFKVLSNLVLSQVKLHEKYGGVFPNLAKREHSKNLAPLIHVALEEAGLLVAHVVGGEGGVQEQKTARLTDALKAKIKTDLSHEPELYTEIIKLLESTAAPKIDLIAVTFGPGLEPALWVGINAAKVLGEAWGIPVMPVNHMEGHISSVLLNPTSPMEFPAVALLISGGHTELVHIPDWLEYKVVGQTRDDAVGEAYDKVARMLGLPYPGGPQIGSLAEENRLEKRVNRFTFPRPMLKTDDLDFSFSGLKTSVLYTVRKIENVDLETKKEIAEAFEDAIVETLVTKTKKAIEEFSPRSLIIAGGVIANKTIRTAFENLVVEFPETKLLIPSHGLSTDNALMIAIAAYIRHSKNPESVKEIKAEGNVQLA